MRYRVIAAITVVVLGLVPATATAAPNDRPSDEEVLAGLNDQSLEIVDTAARSLNLDRLAAVHKLRFQSSAAQTVDNFRARYGAIFAGSRFDPTKEIVQIGVVGDVPVLDDGVVIDQLPVEFLRANLTAAEFADARDSVSLALYATGEAVAMRSDDLTSSVAFFVASDASDAERAAVSAAIAQSKELSIIPSVEELTRSQLSKLVTPNLLSCTKGACDRIQGGLAIGPPGSPECTSSVLAQQASGQWYQFTAGHCNRPSGNCSGTQPIVTYANGSNTIGQFNAACYQTAVPLDMGGIQVSSSMQLGLSAHMSNTLQYKPLGPLTSAPSGGEYLCQTGFKYFSYSSAASCGYASSYGVQTVSGHQRYWVNMPGCTGDSGAIVAKEAYWGGQFHYQATGMISVGDNQLPNWGGHSDCYGAVGITALATEFAVWNGWGWGLTYYSDPNY